MATMCQTQDRVGSVGGSLRDAPETIFSGPPSRDTFGEGTSENPNSSAGT